MVIVASVAAQEHAEAAHDVGYAELQTARVELDGRIDVGHAKYHVVDLLGTGALIPFAVPIPAHDAGQVVLILSWDDSERLALEYLEADADARVVAAAHDAVAVEVDCAIAFQLAPHRFERSL